MGAALAPNHEGRTMKEVIDLRFRQLIEQGDELVRAMPSDQHGMQYWVHSQEIARYYAWISSSANLIEVVTPADSHLRADRGRILQHSDLPTGIPTSVVQKILGLLKAVFTEWEHGLLRKVEYIVAASTFDDFLDHAVAYHKGNKKVEASVLMSAVLENTIRKIAQKNDIPTEGQALEQVIDSLQKADVFTPVKAKRVKGFASVRNRALHAEWDAFDIRDVGDSIAGTRELLEEFL